MGTFTNTKITRENLCLNIILNIHKHAFYKESNVLLMLIDSKLCYPVLPKSPRDHPDFQMQATRKIF